MRYEIEGGSLPALVIQLEPGEGLVSESGGRTWIRGPITTNVKADGGLGGSIGRMFSGESLFLNHYKANGAGEIAFTSSFPGRIVSRQLAPGFFGGEGFIMQKVTGPGLAFFEIDGYSKEYNLAAGEQLVCDTGVVAMMDPTCEMDVRMVGSVKNALFGGEGLVDTVITGPGKVMLQTMPIYKVASAIQPYIIQSK